MIDELMGGPAGRRQGWREEDACSHAVITQRAVSVPPHPTTHKPNSNTGSTPRSPGAGAGMGTGEGAGTGAGAGAGSVPHTRASQYAKKSVDNTPTAPDRSDRSWRSLVAQAASSCTPQGRWAGRRGQGVRVG